MTFKKLILPLLILPLLTACAGNIVSRETTARDYCLIAKPIRYSRSQTPPEKQAEYDQANAKYDALCK
jgi:hypothetical protein